MKVSAYSVQVARQHRHGANCRAEVVRQETAVKAAEDVARKIASAGDKGRAPALLVA